jgi:sulfofructose kinase
MANILILANLNCDRILRLDKPLQTGGRFHYQDGGLRLGGGGANTGIGLVWAQHKVAIVSQVGSDDIGDWILAKASTYGLDCRMVQRFEGNTCEMLLVMTPDGERTIIRPQRPIFTLQAQPQWQNLQGLYVNSSAMGAEIWAQTAMEHCLVVAQLAKDDRPRPCQVLIASKTDFIGRSNLAPWEFAKQVAGDKLEYFIVTDGEDGACLYNDKGCTHVPAMNATVLDTTGAGDAYAAGVIHGLCSDMDILAAMEEGARWAAFAVSTPSSIPGEGLKQYLDGN